MKRLLSFAIGAVVLMFLGSVAFAWMGGGPMGAGMMGAGPMGRHMMGAGPMGGGMKGAPAGQAGCPGVTGAGAAEAVSEERAKTLAQEYADKYLQGFSVDKVLPFTGRHGTGYSVELKGPKDEVRVLHVTPFGGVMPFGGPGRRAAG